MNNEYNSDTTKRVPFLGSNLEPNARPADDRGPKKCIGAHDPAERSESGTYRTRSNSTQRGFHLGPTSFTSPNPTIPDSQPIVQETSRKRGLEQRSTRDEEGPQGIEQWAATVRIILDCCESGPTGKKNTGRAGTGGTSANTGRAETGGTSLRVNPDVHAPKGDELTDQVSPKESCPLSDVQTGCNFHPYHEEKGEPTVSASEDPQLGKSPRGTEQRTISPRRNRPSNKKASRCRRSETCLRSGVESNLLSSDLHGPEQAVLCSQPIDSKDNRTQAAPNVISLCSESGDLHGQDSYGASNEQPPKGGESGSHVLPVCPRPSASSEGFHASPLPTPPRRDPSRSVNDSATGDAATCININSHPIDQSGAMESQFAMPQKDAESTPLKRKRTIRRGRGNGSGAVGPSPDNITPPELPPLIWDGDLLVRICKSKFRTIESVPHSCRHAIAISIGNIVKSILDHPGDNTKHWVELWAFFKVVLCRAPIAMKNNPSRFTRQKLRRNYTNARIFEWEKGNRDQLVVNLLNSEPPEHAKPVTSHAENNVRRCVKLAQENGQYGKAVQALMSSGVAPCNEATARIMREKHPVGPTLPQEELREEHAALLTTTWDEVRSSLLSFSKGTACGPSGMRAAHLLEILGTGLPDLQDNWVKIVNLAIQGKAPRELAHLFAGANLVPLFKDGKPIDDLRPIAIGEIFRRMCGKILLKKHWLFIQQRFKKLQLGVGVKNGAEGLLLGINAILEKPEGLEELFVLLIDFENAFNQVSREFVMREILEHFPSLAPYVSYTYGVHSYLFFGDFIILSAAGTQQGDPMAGFLFALVLHPLLEKLLETLRNEDHYLQELPAVPMHASYSGVLQNSISAFFDDVTMLLRSEAAAKVALDFFAKEGPERGLFLKLRKSALHKPLNSHSEERPTWLPVEVEWSVGKGFVLLGGAVSCHGADHASVSSVRVDRTTRTIDSVLAAVRSRNLNVQTALMLIRSCTGMAQMMYSWRISPPEVLREPSTKLQEALIAALRFLTVANGEGFNDFQVLKASLPLRYDGLGISMPEDTAHFAHLAALAATEQLRLELFPARDPKSAKQLELLASFKTLVPTASHPAVDEAVASPAKVQHQLAELFYRAQHVRLLSHPFLSEQCAPDITTYHNAKLTATIHESSIGSDWLLALPNPGLGQLMDDQQYRIALRFFFLIPFTKENLKCPHCAVIADKWGYHSLSCQGYDNRTHARHELVAGALAAIARAAGFTAVLNAKVGCLGYASGSLHRLRPADMLLSEGSIRQTCVDTTIASPMCPTYIALPTGQLAKTKAASKISKHAAACDNAGFNFQPFSMDTCGILDARASSLLSRFADSYAAISGLATSHSKAICRRRISFSLQRGIAAQLTALAFSDLLDDYFW